MILKILRFIGRLLLFFVLAVFLVVVVMYLRCPVYRFPQPHLFTGQQIYNPYQGMDPSHWRKANFQVQSYAWCGLTDGRKNSNEQIHDIYSLLGYDVIGISDYMKINRYGHEKPSYVPVYEHGYSIKKVHQVLIGAGRVLWRDYPLYQNIDYKQDIINHLRKDNQLIFLAHPLLRHGYSLRDMHYLTNYDGIEVLNNARLSIHHWDEALSAGHFATILGDDDGHDLSNPDEAGRRCTIINAPAVTAADIIDALKRGNAFGADVAWIPGESYASKKIKHDDLPVVTAVDVVHDTLQVAVDRPAVFRFIGQGGVLRKTDTAITRALYAIQPADTYVRTEIAFPNGTVYYLNPVIRYNGVFPIEQPAAVIDKGLTLLFRIIYVIVAAGVLSWLYLRYFRRRRTSRE
jgi:hypothetical protein